MDLFAQNILDHFKNPRNKKKLNNPSVTQTEANYACGDSANVYINIENNIVKEIAFDGSGCSISQATLSMLMEEFEGMDVDEVLLWHREHVVKMLGIPVSQRRERCALLGLLAIQNAILKFLEKPLRRFNDLVEGNV